MSVCSTGTNNLARSFSRQLGISDFGETSPRIQLSALLTHRQAFDSSAAYRLSRAPSARTPILPCHSIARNDCSWGRKYEPAIHHLRLSTSAKVPPNPGRTTLPQETLGLRRRRFSLLFTLLIPAFALPGRPAVLTGPPSDPHGNAPLPHNTNVSYP